MSRGLAPYYHDDYVTIYHADSIEWLTEGARSGPVVLCDLVLTDPPFFMPAQHYASRSKGWQRTWGDTAILGRWWASVVDAVVPWMATTGQFFTFCDDESYPVFYPEMYRRFDGLTAIVWDKGSIGMGTPWRHQHELIISARWKESKWTGGGGQSDVLKASSLPTDKRLHPVDKPVDLLTQLIAPTTAPGDVVLDPFMGGGSTLEAAKRLGRKAIGVEIEERYCEIAARRCAQDVLPLEAAA